MTRYESLYADLRMAGVNVVSVEPAWRGKQGLFLITAFNVNDAVLTVECTTAQTDQEIVSKVMADAQLPVMKLRYAKLYQPHPVLEFSAAMRANLEATIASDPEGFLEEKHDERLFCRAEVASLLAAYDNALGDLKAAEELIK